MKDINNYIVEKLHINNNMKLVTEKDEIISYVVNYYKEKYNIKKNEDYDIVEEISPKNIYIHFKFNPNRINKDVLSDVLSCGTELCTGIENDLGYDWYWGFNTKELRLSLTNNFI